MFNLKSKGIGQHSISTAVSSLLVGSVLVITVVYSLLLVGYAWIVQDNIFNRQVDEEANYIRSVFQTTGEVVPPRAPFMTLHPDWQGLPAEFKQESYARPDKIEFDSPDGRTIHIQRIDLDGITYVLAADVAGFEVNRDYLPNVVWALVFLSVFFCVVVAVIAFFKARKITRPLINLASQVSIEENIEQADIQGTFPNNEVGVLANAIKTAFQNLKAAWTREANFTKDVSHEIRTPIAVMHNILAKPQESLTQSQWRQLKQASLTIKLTTKTLLALARNESTITSTVNLSQLLEQCVLSNSDVNHTEKGKRINFEIDCPKDVFKEVSLNLIEILINNILSNIVHNTSEENVFISLYQDKFEFTNSYHNDLPEQLMQSGQRGQYSHGIGHGLSLISRIAELYDWQVGVNVEDGHFSLFIYF